MVAIIPIDYWHVKDRAYTQEEAYNFVAQSIADVRRLTGKPNMPVSIAGQGFDAFREGTGSNNPSPQEVQGAIQADNGMCSGRSNGKQRHGQFA